MLAPRTLLRSLPRRPLLHRFTHSSSPPPPLLRPRRKLLLYTSLSLFSLSLLSFHPSLAGLIHADSPLTVSLSPGEEYSDTSLASLIRSYVVFTMCSFPRLVDASPWLMELVKVPVVGAVVRGVVRVTFFGHFVGGDSVEQTVPLISTLRHAKKGTLLAYSVEVDENDATSSSSTSTSTSNLNNGVPPHQKLIDEMTHSIEVAADFEDTLQSTGTYGGRRTWVAVKLSALVPDPQSLVRLSTYITQHTPPTSSPVPFPGHPSPSHVALLNSSPSSTLSTSPSSFSSPFYPLTEQDLHDLKNLYLELRKLSQKASERGVKLIVDAEYTWYQPGIDLFVRGLSGEFNRLEEGGAEQPVVYGTYQAYLRRTPAQIRAALQDARKNGYALGVKLVRGAYHPHEVAAWNSAHGVPSSILENQEKEDGNKNKAKSVSISPDTERPPVWEKKEDTDACYDECVSILVDAVKADIDSRTTSSSFSIAASPAAVGKAVKRWIPFSFFGLGPSSSSSSASTSSTLSQTSASTSTLTSTSRAETTKHSQPTIGVLFGTHNWESCRHLLRELGRCGLAEVITGPSPSTDDRVEEKAKEVGEATAKEAREVDGVGEAGSEIGDDVVVRIPSSVVSRIAVGQLFGMSDDLTNYMVKRTLTADGTPFVVKYVPYGALAEVMPYLSRRAIENKSVLGGGAAALERQRAGREIWKRVFRG